jgi:predicted ATPase
MRFEVISSDAPKPRPTPNVGYLRVDHWDDWFEFSTLYVFTYFDHDGKEHNLGGVKIGQFQMAKKQRRPDIPERFKSLDDRFFSLGQDVDYYASIAALEPATAGLVFASLNDIAADSTLYIKARKERVTGTSLMRFVNAKTITGQFRRIIHGGARLTDYAFSYLGPKQLNPHVAPLEFSFEVAPDSKPPTNVHVIIGRNGVGKSFTLNAMSRALVLSANDPDNDGRFSDESKDVADASVAVPFANVVSVTFSAFDDFPLIPQRRNATKGVRYTNIGLRKRIKKKSPEGDTEWIAITQQPNELTDDFIGSAKACVNNRQRRERLRKALQTLESDPIFAEADVTSLLDKDTDTLGRPGGQIFRKLSSGHKIVLLTTTKLVECVEERTVVLMDEPEAHLHPPLLAALIRAISDLLINRNGVAIIATHSPVVLQEVPRKCVWKLRRHGGSAVIERPMIETFAENVGRLTHDVFGLEVTRAGFHKMIGDAIRREDHFEDVVGRFSNEIGLEGRALIAAQIAQRNTEDGQERR